jgi:hypothetical protein
MGTKYALEIPELGKRLEFSCLLEAVRTAGSFASGTKFTLRDQESNQVVLANNSGELIDPTEYEVLLRAA